jgi:hypothetical protein
LATGVEEQAVAAAVADGVGPGVEIVVDGGEAGADRPAGVDGPEPIGNRIECRGKSGCETEREAFVRKIGKGAVEKEQRSAGGGGGVRHGREERKERGENDNSKQEGRAHRSRLREAKALKIENRVLGIFPRIPSGAGFLQNAEKFGADEGSDRLRL